MKTMTAVMVAVTLVGNLAWAKDPPKMKMDHPDSIRDHDAGQN